MKKILSVLTLLLLLVTFNVNAEIIKVGKDNYLDYEGFYCGDTPVTVDDVIGKTGYTIVSDEDDNSYIWLGNNECRDLKTQDYLDYFNSSSSSAITEADKVTVTTSNLNIAADISAYIYAYTPAQGEFDPNESYYEFFGDDEPMANPIAANVNSYYVKKYFKHPDSETPDENIQYYACVLNVHCFTVDFNTVETSNMTNTWVMTTEDVVNTKETIYNVNQTVYDSIDNASKDLLVINNKLYIRADYANDDIKYFDNEGNEITKFRNKVVESYDYYYVVLDPDLVDFHMATGTLSIYRTSDDALIKTITYDDNNKYNGMLYEGNTLIIWSITNDGNNSEIIRHYTLLEGDNQTFNNDNLVIRFNGNYNLFKELKINDEVVPTDKYTVTEGSTIITLKKDYLNTLDNGDYTLKVVYKDGGTVSTTFKVDKNTINDNDEENDTTETNPNTIDNKILYITIGLISLGGLYIIYKKEA